MVDVPSSIVYFRYMPTNPKLLISAETLRELRADRALSQPELAEAVEMSVQNVKRLEGGGARVFPSTAKKLAKFFKVEVHELLTRR